jgi:hypothetical protein
LIARSSACLLALARASGERRCGNNLKSKYNVIQSRKNKISYTQKVRFTFQIFDSITIPNKLGTETDEMFHQRLQRESRDRVRREKLDKWYKMRLTKSR